MNLIEHAEMEFKFAGYIPLDQDQEDGPNKWIQENVLELLRVFSNQGHSGFSASYAINMFSKLAKYESLTPLQGTDDEWVEVSNGLYQNKRCSHIFKENDIAYDSEGYIFKDKTGNCFTGYESARRVTFPCTPKSIYIYVNSYEVNKETNEPEEGSGWWHTEFPQYILNERERLKKDLGKE